jgi:hypothetical protein
MEEPDSVSSVLAQAREVIARSPHRGIKSLKCELVDGKVAISGEVSSFYLKQMAQECLLGENIPVLNQVRVLTTESVTSGS